jgi:hypothetical protein
MRRVGDQGRFWPEGPETYRVMRVIRILDWCGEDITLRVDAHDPQEQVPEEPFGVAQERALALDASQLPEQSQRNVFLVRDPLESLLASRAGVEVRVCVIYESQEGNDRLFRSSEALSMVPVVHPELLWSGVDHPGPLFVSANHAIYIWASESSLGYLMPMGNRQLIRGVGASRRIATGLIVATFAVLLIAWGYDSEPTPSAEVVAAGDIASCRTQGDEATAELVEGIEGTVLALGDEAYPKGSAANFEECYGPSWGGSRGHQARPRQPRVYAPSTLQLWGETWLHCRRGGKAVGGAIQGGHRRGLLWPRAQLRAFLPSGPAGEGRPRAGHPPVSSWHRRRRRTTPSATP